MRAAFVFGVTYLAMVAAFLLGLDESAPHVTALGFINLAFWVSIVYITLYSIDRANFLVRIGNALAGKPVRGPTGPMGPPGRDGVLMTPGPTGCTGPIGPAPWPDTGGPLLGTLLLPREVDVRKPRKGERTPPVRKDGRK